MHVVLLIVSSFSLVSRTLPESKPSSKETRFQSSLTWGKVKRESIFEAFINILECLIWIITFHRYLTSIEDLRLNRDDSEIQINSTGFLLALLSSLISLISIDQESMWDTFRRLLGWYYCCSFHYPLSAFEAVQVLIMSLTTSYRLLFGMGICDKYEAWGLRLRQTKKTDEVPRSLNILVLSIGTRGDVQPFIYLGQEMKLRGHTVTICGLEKYRSLVERNGLLYKNAGIDDLEESKFWRRCSHVSEVMADSIPNFRGNFLKIGKSLYEAAEQSQADVLVVTSTAQSISLSISEKLKIPTFVVKFAPDFPTRQFAAPGYETKFPHLPKVVRLVFPERVFNLFSWYHHWIRIGLASIKCKLGQVENEYREQILNLKPLKGGIRLKEMGACPNFCAFSNIVVPTPRDWPGNCLVTGWWLPPSTQVGPSSVSPSSSSSSVAIESEGEEVVLEQPIAFEDATNSIPANVTKFLGTKQQVICITFGSMSPTAEALNIVPLLIQACFRVFGSTVRILIVGSKFHSLATEQVMVIDEAPYHLLFPYCKFVIHHGGAGTSASCIETCVPSLVIPILIWTDQPLWGQQLEKLGVGLHVEQKFAFRSEQEELAQAHQTFLKASETALKRLEEEFCSNPYSMKHRRFVADQVGTENGVIKAADAIEFLLHE